MHGTFSDVETFPAPAGVAAPAGAARPRRQRRKRPRRGFAKGAAVGALVVIPLISLAIFGVGRLGLGGERPAMIPAWGPPSSQYTMPNGDVMYTWLRVGGTLVTASYDQYIDAIRARSVTYWCKTTFTTDTNNVIRRALSEGNACRSHK